MTVNTASGRRFTINETLVMSLHLAGLLESSQGLSNVPLALQTLCKNFLQTIMDDLGTDGVLARTVAFYDLPLVAGTYVYAMPATTMDVISEGAWIDPSTVDLTQASGEMLVMAVSRDAWNRISDKGATGLPTRYYVHRELDIISVRLWPVPDAAHAGWVRFQVHRYFADDTDGNTTIDLETYWSSFVVHELAALLAESQSLPNDKVERLASKAAAKRIKAKQQAMAIMNNQAVVGHMTPWSGR